MNLYKCSKCEKQVIPEGFKKMGVNPNPKRFCCCKTPNIAESKAQYEENAKKIAQAISILCQQKNIVEMAKERKVTV